MSSSPEELEFVYHGGQHEEVVPPNVTRVIVVDSKVTTAGRLACL
jgi:hypothetical protein